MVGQLNKLPTSIEPIAVLGEKEIPVRVTTVWFKFFQSVASLYSNQGGGGGASAILDTIGSTIGGMLSRFGDGWQEFEATVANSIPVMNPGAPITLRTIGQLLDSFGTVQGDILFRGALGWQVLPPSAGRFLQSQGAGADPSYVVGTNVYTVATGLVAAGTVQGDALTLTANWNEVATTALNSGVKLASLGVGQPSLVFNQGANPLNVYPPVGGTIDTLAANAPYVLAATKGQQFSQLTATRWRSLQLG